MDTVAHQRMLADLRTTFNKRLPAGLTPRADARLRRTLNHWSREVARVQGGGAPDEQEVLRKSYDSLVSWFRRNPDALVPGAPDIEAAVAPDAAGPGLSVIGGPPFDGEVADPLSLFKARAATEGTASTPLASLLTPIETRPKPPTDMTFISRPPTQPVQPKDFVQRDEDVVKYREVEYNLLMNSKDRNWLQEVGQNRYNFTVILNAGGRGRGTSAQPSIQNRFRNIVRLEFVKAILPVESLDLIVPKRCPPIPPTTPVPSAFYSVLGMPFVTVVCDEHEGNNYGTTDVIDKSLAVCQYDAMWRSDSFQTNDNTSRGYTLYFPKFMKAQRVYAPTPLATFQQLTFQLLNPENQVLSKTPDVYTLTGINNSAGVGGSCYSDATTGLSGNYIFVQTKDYFPVWAFSQLDRVEFGGQSGTTAAADSFVDWLQRDEGHVIVGTAYGSVSGTVTDGYNSDGYANCIIIQSRYAPPDAMGSVAVDYFNVNAAGDTIMLSTQLNAIGKMLNLSRQVQLVLRVVCREKDPTTNLRPDNI